VSQQKGSGFFYVPLTFTGGGIFLFYSAFYSAFLFGFLFGFLFVAFFSHFFAIKEMLK
jgi:hypothetical protein